MHAKGAGVLLNGCGLHLILTSKELDIEAGFNTSVHIS